MVKKLLYISICLVAAVTVLVGCQGSVGGEQKASELIPVNGEVSVQTFDYDGPTLPIAVSISDFDSENEFELATGTITESGLLTLNFAEAVPDDFTFSTDFYEGYAFSNPETRVTGFVDVPVLDESGYLGFFIWFPRAKT